MGKKKPKANGRKPADKPPGCYVLSLSVENVRCFGPKQTLDCSDGNGRPRQWTVILGDNGSGKTTLLQAIANHPVISSHPADRDLKYVSGQSPTTSELFRQGTANTQSASEVVVLQASKQAAWGGFWARSHTHMASIVRVNNSIRASRGLCRGFRSIWFLTIYGILDLDFGLSSQSRRRLSIRFIVRNSNSVTEPN